MKPTLVIAGLGNPGTQYENTRHNVGFFAIDIIAKEYATEAWIPRQKFYADVCEGRIVTVPILLVKPTTYMNLSGDSLHKIMRFYDLDPASQLLVLCDDIDQKVGNIKLKTEGGSGSHNGLKSIVTQFGESFARIRIGVRGMDVPEGSFQQRGEDLSSYVLSKPSANEVNSIKEAVSSIPKMVEEFVMEEKE